MPVPQARRMSDILGSPSPWLHPVRMPLYACRAGRAGTGATAPKARAIAPNLRGIAASRLLSAYQGRTHQTVRAFPRSNPNGPGGIAVGIVPVFLTAVAESRHDHCVHHRFPVRSGCFGEPGFPGRRSVPSFERRYHIQQHAVRIYQADIHGASRTVAGWGGLIGRCKEPVDGPMECGFRPVRMGFAQLCIVAIPVMSLVIDCSQRGAHAQSHPIAERSGRVVQHRGHGLPKEGTGVGIKCDVRAIMP